MSTKAIMATSPRDIQAIVTSMNAGWYNYAKQLFGVTDPNFQIAQGCLGLRISDSSGLFLMSDAVPASALVSYYDPSALSKRSSAYGKLLAVLAEKGSTASAPLKRALDAMSDSGSQQTFLDSAQNSYSLFRYSASSGAATEAIGRGASLSSVNFHTDTMNTDLSHTTVERSASGSFGIFSGIASGGMDQLNARAAGSGIGITGYINKFATLVTEPVGWFNPSEVRRAYSGRNDSTIWDSSDRSGGWDSFFGQPNGQLARRISSLLLVSDYKLTVTSKASYSQADYRQIKTTANFGAWPFFSASGSATNTTETKLNSDSTLSVVHTLHKDLIQIWGVFTADAPN